jgi:hypothetical protein
MSVFAQATHATREAYEAESALRKAVRDSEVDSDELAKLAAKFAKAHNWAEDCRAEARDPGEA